jgi:hypothetical protein
MSLPRSFDKTIEDWRFWVAVTCEKFHGCSIERVHFEILKMTPSMLIEGTDYEFSERTIVIGFRKKGKSTDLKFGDEASKDRKSQRVDAAYVWASLF